MSPMLKRRLIVIGGVVGFLVFLALIAPLLVNINRYKPQLEIAASDALGMRVRLGGRLGMGLFPAFHVSAEDALILTEQGVAFASARRTRLWIDLIPLLHKQLRFHRIEVAQPRLYVERDSSGRLNAEPLKKSVGLLGALDGGSVSVSDGTLHYLDRRSGEEFDAVGLDVALRRIHLAGEKSPRIAKRLSLEGEVACREIRAKNLSVSALNASVHGSDGVFEIQPVTMSVFGGQATGTVRADISGPVPSYQVRYSLPAFRIEEFLKVLSPKRAAEGRMAFTASLSMQGKTRSELVETAAGAFSLRGSNLTLVGNDLDLVLSRYQASQHFNLVDVGAVFLAGPLGLAVTKGYNFASLFRETGGSTAIRTVVSDWRVERGLARATDVALATAKNRIALQGGLDFASGRYSDMVVAVVDGDGCALVRQEIHGPFGTPEVEKPRMLKSLTGPMVKLYQKARGLFPSGPCDVFYSGSVPPPE